MFDSIKLRSNPQRKGEVDPCSAEKKNSWARYPKTWYAMPRGLGALSLRLDLAL